MAMFIRCRTDSLLAGVSLAEKALFRAWPYSNRNAGDAGAPACCVAVFRLSRALVCAAGLVSFRRFWRLRSTNLSISARPAVGALYVAGLMVGGAATAGNTTGSVAAFGSGVTVAALFPSD